jgi:hypothetical protein
MDEALVGGKGGPHKELVLVAAEAGGRVRLAHAATNDKATLKRFADRQIAVDARVITDGLGSYDGHSLGERPHDAIVQSKVERRESDALQGCHWTISLLKRWLLGTHAGAVGPKHLQAYLDEVRLPPEPAQDQRRRPDRGARHRAACSSPAADHALADRRNAALPIVPPT